MSCQLGVPFSIVEFLLSHNSRLNFNDFAHLTSSVEPYLVEPLYDSVDLDKHDSDGMTAFHLAIRSNHLEGVRRLLRRGANVNQKTANLLASTPLHLAAEFASLQCMELLLQHGADPIAMDALHNSALTRVVKYHHFSFSNVPSQPTNKVELLLEYGADLDDVLLKAWLFETSEESLRTMVQYMALRDLQDVTELRENSMLPFSDPELYSFYVKCREEVAQMRDYTIFRHLSVYQFMKRKSRDLLRYVTNSAFESSLRDRKLRLTFPSYYEMMTRHYDVLCEQKKIFAKAGRSLETILRDFRGNHLITEKIMSSLGVQDMWNLIYAADSMRSAS